MTSLMVRPIPFLSLMLPFASPCLPSSKVEVEDRVRETFNMDLDGDIGLDFKRCETATKQTGIFSYLPFRYGGNIDIYVPLVAIRDRAGLHTTVCVFGLICMLYFNFDSPCVQTNAHLFLIRCHHD